MSSATDPSTQVRRSSARNAPRPRSAAQGGQVLAPCVVCHTPTSGTYGGEFPVCLRCYATGRLTEEHIALYGRHTEEP